MLSPRSWIEHGSALVLAGVFLVAVAGKVLHPASFADQIVAEGLDVVLPPAWTAVLVLSLETALGMLLLLGVRHRALLGVTASLVIFFLGLTGRNYWRALQGILPEEASCGCFGYLVERTPAEAFWGDLALLGLPMLLLLLATRFAPAPAHPRRLVLAGLAAVGIMVLAVQAPSLPVDDLATRLGPGVRPAELCVRGGETVCLTDLAPGLEEGQHWVVLAELGPVLEERSEALNQFRWDQEAEGLENLWVLTTAPKSEIETFRWTAGPAYELVGETPSALFKPLYRTLPRSFEVRDGEVVRTVTGWPPGLGGEP